MRRRGSLTHRGATAISGPVTLGQLSDRSFSLGFCTGYLLAFSLGFCTAIGTVIWILWPRPDE